MGWLNAPATVDQPYVNIAVTQNPLNTYTVTGTGSDLLWPPSVPVTVGSPSYNGYVKMGNLENINSYLMDVTGGDTVTFPSDGRYNVEGFANFIHSHNNSTIAFVFALENDGFYRFGQRPVKQRIPNIDDPGHVAGEAVIMAQEGWKTSLWVASNNSGTITADTISVIISRFMGL